MTNLVTLIRPFFKLTFDDIIIIPCFMLLLGKGVMLVASGIRCRIACKRPTAKIGKAGKAFAFGHPLQQIDTSKRANPGSKQQKPDSIGDIAGNQH